MARIRENFVRGTVDDDPLTSGATTLNSAGLADLPVVTSPDIAIIVLDPNEDNGEPEVVHVTAHSASATTATILRAQESTSARSHPMGSSWLHAPTVVDFLDISATNPVTQAIGDSPDAGSASDAAAQDHKHGMPAFGSVTAATAGDTSANGNASTVARSDHNHGHPLAIGTNHIEFSALSADPASPATDKARLYLITTTPKGNAPLGLIFRLKFSDGSTADMVQA